MSEDSSAAPDMDRDTSAGVIALVSDGLSVVRRKPVLFGVFLITAVSSLLLPSFLNSFVGLIVTAYAVVVAYRAVGGRPEGGVSFGIRVVIVLIAGILVGIAILVGLVLLVVPGLYLLARLRLATAAVMLDDCGPLEALGRSFELTEGHTLTVFGVVVLFGGIGFVILGAVALAMGVFAGGTIDLAAFQRAARIGGAITAILISPVGVATDAAMYGLYETER